jgi:zinc transporter ZupT
MEQHTSIWKANFSSGLILGFIAVVYTLIIYAIDFMFNPYQGYVFYIVQAVGLFIFIKSYRVNYKNGFITYGQAFASGVVISLFTAIIYAIFIFILYTLIDTDLVNKQLAFIEETFVKAGLPQAIIDSGLKMQKKFLQPQIYAPTKLLSSLLTGIIFSLFVAIFIRKGNKALIYNSEVK